MRRTLKQERILAVRRYFRGENIRTICESLGRHPNWLHKWIKRHDPDNDSWACDQSRRAKCQPHRTSQQIEQLITVLRKRLFDEGLFYGAQAIIWELEDIGVTPLPSARTINRIVRRLNLPGRRTEPYQPKGILYPALVSAGPNQVQQADMVGPCYLRGPHRFYGLNVVDLATARCAVEPLTSKASQSIIEGFWRSWGRLGMPRHLQVDNELSFYGSRRYPRGMGALIRLCLLNDIQLWFIPQREPWRNGVVEKFNGHYRKKFLARVPMNCPEQLRIESLRFEDRHNQKYRYSKLKGKTPQKALAQTGISLKFPPQDNPPTHPLDKPQQGQYHLVRLIRSNLKLDIFGEIFSVPPELQYEYVVATINVKEQKLKLFHDHIQVDERDYQLR